MAVRLKGRVKKGMIEPLGDLGKMGFKDNDNLDLMIEKKKSIVEETKGKEVFEEEFIDKIVELTEVGE